MRYPRMYFRVFHKDDDGAGSGGGETPPPFDLAKWLESAPQEARDALSADTAGLKRALDAERDARKAAEKTQKDREAAEAAEHEKRLAEQNEFKTLAEERAKKLADLEPVATELESLKQNNAALEATIKTSVEAEIKELTLPDAIKELLSGKTLLEQHAWLTKNRETFKKDLAQRAKGAPANPDPNKNGGSGQDDEAARKALSNAYRRAF